MKAQLFRKTFSVSFLLVLVLFANGLAACGLSGASASNKAGAGNALPDTGSNVNSLKSDYRDAGANVPNRLASGLAESRDYRDAGANVPARAEQACANPSTSYGEKDAGASAPEAVLEQAGCR